MSNTSNLNLERPDKGDSDWHTSLNSNFTKLDTGYGNNVATVADLPEVYIETGTFNYTSGDVITLPKSVDAVNEYSVTITATSRAGAIGDIYVTKTTSNFTVYCSSNNTTDTFAAVIYYIGDVNSYGGSIYRRWYVSPDASITDHSDSSDAGSLAWVLNEIGASPATVEFPGNKIYNITGYDVTSNDNIDFVFQHEAVIAIGSGRAVSHAGGIRAGDGQIVSMVDRDSFTYTGTWELHSTWFGAKHDNSTDDSNALNDMVGACSSEGNGIVIDRGFARCNSFDIDVDNLTVRCIGKLKPYTDSGYCIGVGNQSSSNTFRITIYNLYVDTGSNYETYTTVTGIRVSNLHESKVHIRNVEGCKIGLLLTNGTSTGVAYNNFYLGRVIDNEVNVKLDPANSGWVNENNFYGGRFSHSGGLGDYSGTWHIRFEYNATHNTNGNKFYAPSFEGGGDQIAYFGGFENSIQDARVEMTSYSSDSIYFDTNSERNEFTTMYSDGLLSDGPSITDNITSVTAAQFSIDADVRNNLFTGQLIEVTLDDASEHVSVVHGSGYSAPDTTVYLAYEISGYTVTTNEIASIKTLPVYNDGRTNHFLFRNTNYPTVSNLQYESWHETLAFRHGGLSLKGLGSSIPALSIVPGTSAANNVFVISDFNGHTVTINAHGNLTIYDSATGNELFKFDTSNQRLYVNNSNGSTSVLLDGIDSSVTMAISSDGSGVANNSLFVRSSDNKLCWKDNSGTIRALY